MSTEKTSSVSSVKTVESLRAALDQAKFRNLGAAGAAVRAEKALSEARLELELSNQHVSALEKELAAVEAVQASVDNSARKYELIGLIVAFCAEQGSGNREGKHGLQGRRSLFASYHAHVDEFQVECYSLGWVSGSHPDWQVCVDLRKPEAVVRLEVLLQKLHNECLGGILETKAA